ncbi:MAG: efflux RND transporter periplasmic adaptor subunit [Gemmataceae bacterium]
MSVDLRQLAVRRSGGETRPSARRPHLFTRFVLPGAIALGFVAVVTWAARDRLLPSKPVTVVPVLTSRAEVQSEGTPLFQAAGWVEPRPTPVLATALSEGVVESLLVVEGQEVRAGEPVARLIDAETRLAVTAAEADLHHREAEADVLLAKAETDLLYLPFELQTAEGQQRLSARLYADRKELHNQRPELVPEIDLLHYETDLTAANAKVEQLKTRKQRLERDVKSLKRMLTACRLGQAWHDEGPLTSAEADMKACVAHVRQAQTGVDLAKLRQERMTVRAPIGGRVLALMARPGMRLMGQSALGHPEASTVVSLYDPSQLQVRADVRLEDVPRVQPGQKVKVETPAAQGGPLQGVVLFSTSQADIQKNTLQVKVAIPDPPATIRPDMLVQVTFLAPPTPKSADATTQRLRLLIPRQLVETGEGGPRVWVADQAAGVARVRSVKLGGGSGALVEAVEGLNTADRLISSGRDGLRDGQRISVTGEDNPTPTSTRNPDAEHAGKH